MNMAAKELFNQLPPEIPTIVKTYSSDKITILRANNVFTEPKGFGFYKLLIPSRNMPEAIVEKKRFHLKPRKIFPINPDQVHQYTEEKTVETFTPLFINKNYLRDFSYVVFGKSDLFFQNDSFNDIGSNISRLVDQFIEEAENRQPGHEFILQSLNTQIVVNLFRCIKSNYSFDLRLKEYNDLRAVKQIKEYFRSNMCLDFSINDLAILTNYSPYHLVRIFKKHTGKTPFEYLMEIKIEKAKTLLAENVHLVSEVSFLCGFSNRTHFSTVFKRMVGVTPSDYRKLKCNGIPFPS